MRVRAAWEWVSGVGEEGIIDQRLAGRQLRLAFNPTTNNTLSDKRTQHNNEDWQRESDGLFEWDEARLKSRFHSSY